MKWHSVNIDRMPFSPIENSVNLSLARTITYSLAIHLYDVVVVVGGAVVVVGGGAVVVVGGGAVVVVYVVVVHENFLPYFWSSQSKLMMHGKDLQPGSSPTSTHRDKCSAVALLR